MFPPLGWRSTCTAVGAVNLFIPPFFLWRRPKQGSGGPAAVHGSSRHSTCLISFLVACSSCLSAPFHVLLLFFSLTFSSVHFVLSFGLPYGLMLGRGLPLNVLPIPEERTKIMTDHTKQKNTGLGSQHVDQKQKMSPPVGQCSACTACSVGGAVIVFAPPCFSAGARSKAPDRRRAGGRQRHKLKNASASPGVAENPDRDKTPWSKNAHKEPHEVQGETTSRPPCP